MHQLTLITSNEGKRREFEALLGRHLASTTLTLIEPQHWDVAVVAKAKAEQAFAAIRQPVIIDDSAIEIAAWNRLPGALTSWFLERVGNQGILLMARALTDRSASVVTAIGYCDSNGPRTFVGRVAGSLAETERGDNGFGYDTIFIPSGEQRTYAELTEVEKHSVSMRKLAVDELRRFLQSS